MSMRFEGCIVNVPTHTKRCALTSPPQRDLPQRSATERSKNERIDSRTQQNGFLHMFPVRAHIFTIELNSNDRERCTSLAESHQVRCGKDKPINATGKTSKSASMTIQTLYLETRSALTGHPGGVVT